MKKSLYERMNFLAIFSGNLDEFFRVRYPAVIALSALNEKTRIKASIAITNDITEKIQTEVNRQLEIFGALLTKEIIPALKKSGIVFYYNSPIRIEHLLEVKEIFLSNVLAFIQPILLNGNSNRAFIPANNQLYFLVTLKEPGQVTLKKDIINIPSNK